MDINWLLPSLPTYLGNYLVSRNFPPLQHISCRSRGWGVGEGCRNKIEKLQEIDMAVSYFQGKERERRKKKEEEERN